MEGQIDELYESFVSLISQVVFEVEVFHNVTVQVMRVIWKWFDGIYIRGHMIHINAGRHYHYPQPLCQWEFRQPRERGRKEEAANNTGTLHKYLQSWVCDFAGSRTRNEDIM